MKEGCGSISHPGAFSPVGRRPECPSPFFLKGDPPFSVIRKGRFVYCEKNFFLLKCRGTEGGICMAKGDGKVIAQNKKAHHDYFIEETYEAGIVLQGTEIKSIRAGKVNLKDSYAKIENGEVFLHQMHISPYEQGNRFNHDPLRTRKLLLHRKEINKLIGLTKEQGYSLVPLKIYLKNGFAKITLALAKGKKKYDKREDLKKREAKRDIERAFKERQYM
jgi:SsrA-binding protein